MLKRSQLLTLALSVALSLGCARDAAADVVVDIDGNVAHAQISLTDGMGGLHQAEVTITFDSALNLTARSLNLSAVLVNPSDPALTMRLPPATSIDPAFPMQITVEPIALDWLFTTSFDGPENGSGDLSLLNTYEFEVHTHDIAYVVNSPYRLIKAPIGGSFRDFTEDILAGSVRARGRDGAFSQFLVARDSTPQCTLNLLPIALGKLVNLQLRVAAALLGDLLNGDLVALLATVNANLLALDITGAIANLDVFIAEVTAHAGVDIPNIWTARHDLTNDAGEILGLAQTLRFTLVRMSTAPLLPPLCP